MNASITQPHRLHLRQGFTLVEILTVIVIIGILAAIAIPAIQGGVRKARQTAQKLELNTIEQGLEKYRLDFGDYPPDGSNQAVLTRHMKKLFPRMAATELTLLDRLTDNSVDTNPAMPQAFSGAAMDRSEALVFFLGGFSKNIQFPISGPGGPLSLTTGGALGSSVDLADYEINGTRDNSYFPFDPARLTQARAGAGGTGRLVSTDETLLGTVNAAHGGNDLLPALLADPDSPAPIVYFDSRTYGVIGTEAVGAGTRNVYNGYLAFDVGGVRPYKSGLLIDPPAGATYVSEAAAFDAVKFHNPDTFQLIHPGTDGFFGQLVSTSTSDAGDVPIHFTTPNGLPVRPLPSAANAAGLIFTDSNLGSKGFQDSQWDTTYIDSPEVNGHLDNVTSFAESVLENDIE